MLQSILDRRDSGRRAGLSPFIAEAIPGSAHRQAGQLLHMGNPARFRVEPVYVPHIVLDLAIGCHETPFLCGPGKRRANPGGEGAMAILTASSRVPLADLPAPTSHPQGDVAICQHTEESRSAL